MEWIIGIIVVLFILGAMFGGGKEKPKRQSSKAASTDWKTTKDYGGYSIEVSGSIREYDRNAYRFDGLAFPQYRITYADEDGVVTEREIYVDNWRKRGAVTYYFCWCFERDAQRTFRSDRILETVNVQTGRRIKDISAYIMR